MKSKLFSALGFMIFGAVLMGVFLKECQQPSETIRWKVITSVKDSIVEIPVDKWHDKPTPTAVHDTVLKDVDSAAIISNAFATFHAYNTRNDYDVPILDDSTGKFNLVTSVQFNQLQKYRLVGNAYMTYRIKTVETTVAARPVNKFYAGVSLSCDMNYLSTSADIYLVTKRDNLYQASYDPFRHVYKAGTAIKISFRKKQ